MEDFENRPLDTALPIWWWHDDKHSRIGSELLFRSPQCHWSTHPVYFGGRKERQNPIPWHLFTCEPRCTRQKPTNIDQYLNFHSCHHLKLKSAVVNTLFSDDDERVKEFQHVKIALEANNYPDWMLTTPNNASMPYIKSISARLGLQRAYTRPPAYQFSQFSRP